jgi:Bacterial Ig-like domain (group 3)
MVFESTKRWKVPSISIILVLAILSIGLLASPAGADGTVLPGNQNCAQLIPGSRELRVDPAAEGTFTDGTLTVVIDIRTLAADVNDHPGNQTGSQVFDFTATGGTVLGVAVKGGPNTNFYDYRPNGVTSGTGLHAPLGPGGKFSGLSHISFCYVVKANPTIVTQVSNASITIGGSVTDTATLSGGNNPTGSITFTVFGPDDANCSTAGTVVSTETVNGNGNYTSDPFTPGAPGTFRWIASYSGDAQNNPATTACNDANETVVVNKAQPGIVTQVSSAEITIGGSVTDTATLSNGVNPTGSITFTVFGPDDANCSTAGTVVSTETVNGNGNYTSDPFTPGAPGTFRWIASYSGDANNAAATTACNDANETVVVKKAQPTMTTAPNVLPNDKATLSGLSNPSGGTITFDLYLTADCSDNPTTFGPFNVNNNGTFESNNTTVLVTADTVVSWIVTYSGDANNEGATSGCTAEQADIDFTPLGS